MTRFSLLRELVTLARTLEAEGRRMSGRPRADRMCEAAAYRAKAEYMAGRLTDEEYAGQLVEIQDAKNHPID